jgi:hypothetical protein
MAGDARAKHLRRLNRLRRSARGWSVRAGLLVGATAVLVPYRGLGLPDALWAAAAGGSVAVTVWRWLDYRSLAAEPLPAPTRPPLGASPGGERLAAAVRRFPVGRSMMDELDRQRATMRLRGLAVADHWRRLDRASQMLGGLSGRLGPTAEAAVREAAVAEDSLRDLCERAAVVERTMKLGSAADNLRPALESLTTQLDAGVAAYEQFVAAAAGCVATDGPGVSTRLTEATAFLRGVAEGLADFRTTPRYS